MRVTLLPSPTREKLLTIADMAALPRSLPSGDVCYELDRGKLIVMGPPGDSHGRRQAKIIQYLGMFGEDRGHGEARGEVGIVLQRNPDTLLGANAAFILTRSLPVRRSSEGYLETIPELVVEIRSKNDFQPEIAEKIELYFNAGVVIVSVIDPATRTVTAYRHGVPEQTFQQTDTLTCHLMPGFTVPVANLFAGS
jgi:Uma2 family endonuclease